MHTPIRECFAREQVRQAPAAAKPGTVATLVTPEDLQQQNDEKMQQSTMMPGQGSIKPAQALPMHEVSADPTKYPVDHATKLHSFLKNAAGGPATGFVTTNSESHEMARTLAKSGHLQHHGFRPGGGGGEKGKGGGVNHWSMTPKGLAAIGMGGTKKPGQNQPQGARAGKVGGGGGGGGMMKPGMGAK